MITFEELEALLESTDCLAEWIPEADWPVLELKCQGIRHEGSLALKEIIHPEDLATASLQLDRALESGLASFKRGPYRIRHPDKDYVSVMEQCLVRRQDSGKSRILSVFRIQESEAGLRADLLEAQDRLQLAMDATPDGLWDWNLKTDQVFFSAHWKNMLGYRDEEIGNDLEEWRSRVHPDDLELAMKDVQEHLEGRTAYYINEHRMRRKDGSYIWILDRGKASRESNGKPYRMIGFHTDITRHRELEDSLRAFGQELEERVSEKTIELRRQLQKFQLLFNSSNDAFIIHYLDDSEHIDSLIEVNDRACSMLAYDRSDLLLLRFSDLFPAESNPGLQQNVEALLEDGVALYRGFIQPSRGDSIPVDMSSHLFRLPDGWACFSSVRDIADRLKLEKENEEKEQLLIQQSRMASLGEMIGAIAHQWKQPLNAISMAAGMIPDSTSPEELKETEEIIIRQVDFLSRTINEFRDFFRPNQEKKPFRACESAEKLMRIMAPVLRREKIAVTIHSHEHFNFVGQGNEFQQVLLNIISNARDAFAERDIQNRTVDIYPEKKGRTGVIRIRDNAGGIPETLLPQKLFEAYVTTKGDLGTGIGLSLSRRIVEDRMGGKLSARNVEGGAEFSIEVPLAKKES